MQDFIIYPKKGKPFTITIDAYKYEDGRFLLYDQLHQVSKDGYLAFDHIAAIVPANPHRRPANSFMRNALDFRVYLRSGEQFEVNADSCDATGLDTIKFFVTNRKGEDVEIDGIYVAPLEVMAIMPVDGLIYRD